jgi:hypothetical protein
MVVPNGIPAPVTGSPTTSELVNALDTGDNVTTVLPDVPTKAAVAVVAVA